MAAPKTGLGRAGQASRSDKEDGAISGRHHLVGNLGFPSRAQGMGKERRVGTCTQ